MDRRQFVVAAATGALAAAVAPRALAARLGGTWLTFVTADLESHIAVLDGFRLDLVRRIRTGPGPRSIEPAHGRVAVVAHTEHGVVTLVDSETSSIRTDRSSRIRAELDRFVAPRYTAAHPRLPLAYVTDSAAEEVVTLDTREARVLWRTRVPGPARHVSISPDGRTLWSALGNASAQVAVLDATNPRRPRLVRTISPPFLAHDVVFAPGGRLVWVTSGAEPSIAVYRDGGRRPARVLPAGSPPQHVAFAYDKAFVTSGDDGTVHRHRLDGALVREARVPVGSYNVAFGTEFLVTPSLGGGTVTLLDRNGRVRTIRRVARAAHDACIVFGP